MKLARKRMMGQIRDTLKKSCEEGRLVFSDGNGDGVEYTDKEGKTEPLSLGGCAGLLWAKFNDQLSGATGTTQANLAVLDISPDNIKEVLLKLRKEKKSE